MLRVDRQDGVATLTLDRPGVGNALDDALVARLGEALAAFSEVRLGIAPAMIAPFVIARVGPARARRLFCTGETFGAADALAWGLVDRVAPPAELDAAVSGVVADLAKGGPTAIAEAKKLVRDVTAADPAVVPALTCELIARLRAGEEGQEGMAAFLEKRPPRWAR